jgi:hypothetical protein
VIFVACNMALTVISSMAAPKAGVTADQAKTDGRRVSFRE